VQLALVWANDDCCPRCSEPLSATLERGQHPAYPAAQERSTAFQQDRDVLLEH
jgi:hypothetical protein